MPPASPYFVVPFCLLDLLISFWFAISQITLFWPCFFFFFEKKIKIKSNLGGLVAWIVEAYGGNVLAPERRLGSDGLQERLVAILVGHAHATVRCDNLRVREKRKTEGKEARSVRETRTASIFKQANFFSVHLQASQSNTCVWPKPA